MKENLNQRIEWVDIFKALVIISVVIGHATGKYNMFIYQFHMAAFFFISGYTTYLKKRSVFETIWNKACTMLLPFISIFIIGLLFLVVLSKFGYYQYLFEDSFIGFQVAVKQLLLFGNNYVIWMGATWFLIVLLCVVVLHKILFFLCGDKVNTVYILLSIILFALGYCMVRSHVKGQFSIFSLDLTLIAQFYFFLGVVVKEKITFQQVLNKKWIGTIGIIACIGIMYYLGIVHPTTVDYPSRRFNFIITDVLAAVNGTLLTYFISHVLVLLPAKIKAVIIYLGRNTIGIMLFHFMFFKVGYGILILCKIEPFSSLRNFIPTNEIGERYWILFTIIAISLSIALWRIMILTKPMRIILGHEKGLYDNCFEKMRTCRLLRKINKIEYCLDTTWINKMFLVIQQDIIAHSAIVFIIVCLLILTLSPMASEGIIVNDELQARFRTMHGFINSIKEGIGLELLQGRPLRILAPFQNAFSFVSANIYLYKAVQMLILVADLVLFGYFLYKLFRNKKFSAFTCISILVFLPVTFEHAVPNAFIALTGIPMIFLLLSLILFISFTQEKRIAYLIASMLLLFAAMLGYEFIVTFVLLYPVIYFAKVPKIQHNLRDAIKFNIYPIIMGIIYIVLMLGSSALMRTHYSGAQIEFVSLNSTVQILATLLKSSLPGYYVFNAKYDYLFNLYCPDSFPISSGVLNGTKDISIHLSAFIKYIVKNMINLRIVMLILFLLLLLLFILPNKDKMYLKKSFRWWIVLVGLAYMIIPATPISISKLYQGNVNANSFTSLPVSFFLYFSTMFTICYLIWQLLLHVRYRHAVTVVAVTICIYCIPVQAMNSTFARVHYNNYNRLVSIERLFDTAALKNMNYQSIYSPDLYETHNALAIHDSYWSQYAQFKNLNMQVQGGKVMQDEPFQIYYPDGKYFVLCGGNEVSVLSPTRIRDIRFIQVSETISVPAVFENEAVDGSFYRYNFIRSSEDSFLIPKNNSDIPFSHLRTDAGATLMTANFLYGHSNDGWIEKSAEFKIRTGEKGIVILSGYYPNEITGREIGTIYIDGQANPFKIEQNNFTLELSAKINSVVTITIKNDFDFQATPPDTRRLSFVLSDAQGK